MVEYYLMRVSGRTRSAMNLDEMLLNVPCWKMMSCFVYLCCSRCVPAVLLFVQMFLYCVSM